METASTVLSWAGNCSPLSVGPADRARVNVNEPWEVKWWCKEFGCTEEQLRAAVEAVGVMADKVRSHLGK